MTFTTKRILTVAAAITTLIGAGSAIAAAWPAVGWITPNQHAEDFGETYGEIRDFRDEWKCDELEEELQSLLVQQSEGDDSPQTARRIERIKDKRKAMKCSRFDDFD